jgi:hypothetical protein
VAGVKWHILIATERTRSEFLSQLLSLLEPQICALGLRKSDQVDVMIHEDETGKLYGNPAQIGEIREYMRQKSSADYISFVDSDDLVSPNYISTILPLLTRDYVGFQLQGYWNFEPMPLSIHSLEYLELGWYQNDKGFYRDISHVNPMRRDLALAAPMEGGYEEDVRWARKIRALGKVKTQHFVAEPLYHYLIREPKNDAKDAFDPRRLEIIERLRSDQS